MRGVLVAVAMSGVVLGGCSKKAAKKDESPEKAAVVLPAGLFVDAAPEGAMEVGVLRASGPKQGDRVVVHGVVGGSRTPFVPGMAFFTLVGAPAKPCNATPDDECPTPWDFCCESRDTVLANTASVRVVDAKGAALRAEIKGAGGIKELSELVVSGVVSQVDENAIVIDAESIRVVKP
ncbi:MAG: hypothetical protein IT439_01920 [Phycisphaerales bacterium]|nr:hypothetical protein [Phycisphaerales bacterium]